MKNIQSLVVLTGAMLAEVIAGCVILAALVAFGAGMAAWGLILMQLTR